MNQPTPQTLDEILALGEAVLNAEKASADRARAEYAAREEAICEVALTVAKRYIPAPLHPYLRAVFDYPCHVHVHVEIPKALPVTITLENGEVEHNIDDPALDVHANWYVYKNRVHDEIFIYDEHRDRHIFDGSFNDLPRALIIARRDYRAPKPDPEPQPEKPSFHKQMDIALDETEYGDTFTLWKIIARTLVQISRTLTIS